MATVSIITVTLGRPSLEQACESVDRQTYTDWHHYVIGDGVLPRDCASPRRTTVGFAQPLGATEPGLNMPDGTPNPMLRWALRHLDVGRYVCFLDDDNTYKPEFLETMVAALESASHAGIVLCALEDHRYGRLIPGFPDGRCDNSGFLARREVVKRVEFPRASPSKEVVQDCEFISACAQTSGWVRVPKTLVHFGIGDNSPPGRGGVRWLESWSRPLAAARQMRNGDLESAIVGLHEAITDDPLDAWSLWQFGEALLRAGRREQAIEAWRRWLDLLEQRPPMPHDWISYCAGLVCHATGRRALAVAYLRQALDLLHTRIASELSNGDNRLNEGLYNLLMGNKHEGLTAYIRALTSAPATKEIEEALWKLELLRTVLPDWSGIDEASALITATTDVSDLDAPHRPAIRERTRAAYPRHREP
ncbi:MAG: hypothetical protein ACRDYA_19715 [Egibacteraceae bacterium]